jgi:hypothetical protein
MISKGRPVRTTRAALNRKRLKRIVLIPVFRQRTDVIFVDYINEFSSGDVVMSSCVLFCMPWLARDSTYHVLVHQAQTHFICTLR